MSPSPLDDLERCLTAVGRLVGGVGAEQWTAATPCTDWDVRGLVNHLVTGNLMFAAIVLGEPPPDRSADHVGDDPVRAFHASGEALRQAFSQPGVLDRTFSGPLGEQPGSMLVHMRVTELLVHGWDLAHAIGQPADLPDDLAERALAEVRRHLEGHAREGTPFEPEQPAPDEARPVERLAAFLGRSVT